MKELRDIVAVWKQLEKRSEAMPSGLSQMAALATLVKVEGSTYRSPGARMLITSDGQQVGSISGGCLESDVVERSQKVLTTGIPSLVKYDTTSEDDLIWGLGLGCQGVAYVLIEQLNAGQLEALSVVERCLSTKQAGAVATVFKAEGIDSVNQCDRVLLYPDGRIVSQISNWELNDLVTQNLKSVWQQQKSMSQSYVLSEGIAEVFLEVIQPPVSLVIFGAGFDALPLVNFAKALGWYVTVIDALARIQSKKRFQQCDRVVLGFGNLIDNQMQFDEHTVAVVMSHNYLYDLEFLQTIISIPLKYLGILGPKKRSSRLLKDLRQEGFVINQKQLYSPVGLDIGADNPEEIALSIVAEIQAVVKNRQSGFLKDRNTPIHIAAPGYILSSE